MRWTVFTRLVKVDGGVGSRWFWCAVGPEGSQESRPFPSRCECESDAAQHGYIPEDAQEFRFTVFTERQFAPIKQPRENG